jgi:hypothetical protein
MNELRSILTGAMALSPVAVVALGLSIVRRPVLARLGGVRIRGGYFW